MDKKIKTEVNVDVVLIGHTIDEKGQDVVTMADGTNHGRSYVPFALLVGKEATEFLNYISKYRKQNTTEEK